MTKAIAVWDQVTALWIMDCPHCGSCNTMKPEGAECPVAVTGPAQYLFGKVECGRCKSESATMFWNPGRKSKSA